MIKDNSSQVAVNSARQTIPTFRQPRIALKMSMGQNNGASRWKLSLPNDSEDSATGFSVTHSPYH